MSKHVEQLRTHMKTEASSFVPYLASDLPHLRRTCTPLWHPLGFVSCVIKDDANEATVRVHYWPKGERRVKNPDWPIHTHTYDLSSFILAGRIRDLQYRVRSGEALTVYEVSYYCGGSEIVKTDAQLDLDIVVDARRVAGEQYHVPRGIFHQTHVPVSETAVTLVALTGFGSEAPRVLGAPDQARYPYDRRAFDTQRFWDAVEQSLLQIPGGTPVREA